MSELQANLLRASRVARLDALLEQLRAQRPSIDPSLSKDDRLWLAELLHPLTTTETELKLAPAQHSAGHERGLLLEALLTEYSDNIQQLQQELIGLTRLLEWLDTDDQPLTPEDKERIISITSLLRRYLLRRTSMPARPMIRTRR